jgi:hypothetical protein
VQPARRQHKFKLVTGAVGDSYDSFWKWRGALSVLLVPRGTA